MKLKVLSLIALLAGAASGAQAEGQLKIGTEGAYPPWSMADANGAVTGFDADVGNMLCTKLAMVVDGGARYLQLVCQPLRWQMVTDGQTFLTDQVEQAGRNVFVLTHKSSILHGKQGQVHVRRVLVRQNAPEGFAAR